MSVITTNNFKYTAQPIINRTFNGIYNEYKRQYTQVFKTKPAIERASHQEQILFGFDQAVEKNQGDTITYDTAGTAGNANYVFATYSLAFSVTEEMLEDGDHASILNTLTRALAKSMHYTKEVSGANVFNQGFNTAVTGYDSQPLFSTNHNNGPGGSQSNTLPNPTSLSQAGLEQLLINISKFKDGRGLIMELLPEKLVIPPDQRYQATRLLRSILQSGTTNNDLNAVKELDGLEFIVLQRLTSQTNWFVTTNDDFGLTYLDRRPINTQSQGDFDTTNIRYRSTARYAFGFTNWSGCYGVLGGA